MKKVILLSSLLIGGAAFAQTSPIDFEPNGNGADFSWNVFEIPDGESLDFTVEMNPATDGINSSATAAKMDISYSTEADWGQAGCETDAAGMDMGTFSFDGSNSSVRVMVFQEGFTAPVGLKFANEPGGAFFQTLVPVPVADEWVEITFDMSSLIGSPEAPYTQLVFYPSHAPRETGHVVWFDNIVFEEGSSTGNEPMVSAPDPTIDEDNVLSVYSETYMNNTVAGFVFTAFAGGGVYSEVDIENDGNLAGKMEGLTFYGAEWDAEDINAFQTVHLDYWTLNSTAFNFYLIDETAGLTGGEPEEPRYSFGAGADEEIVTGEWVSVEIPLQHFLDFDSGNFPYDLNDIHQYKFDGNGTIWFDNIYFSTDPTNVNDVVSQGLEAFPNPSVDSWTISSDASSINEVRVYNVIGQVVLSESPNSSLTQIDASNLEKGLYVAEVRTDIGVGTIKLIKE